MSPLTLQPLLKRLSILALFKKHSVSSINQKQIAEQWHARGYSCELWIDPPGQRWENFVHDTDEIIVVLQGKMEFEVDGTVHHPEPGEELHVPAQALHSARNTGSTEARWLFGYKRMNRS